MKKPNRVEYSRDGFRDLIAVARWWREHHPSNEDAFDVEYAAAIELLKQFPEAARIALMRRYKGARVKVLVETGHLVVYRYAKATNLVTVVAVRASRATPEKP
jgi:plasmid stabilization system protein ParE